MNDGSPVRTAPLKERLFTFSAGGGRAWVRCHHCGWTTSGSTRDTPAQVVFDMSNDHECDGVESYATIQAGEEDR